MGYNYDKDTCDICRIKKNPLDRRMENSFRLDYDGGVLCALCYKEDQLKNYLN